MEITNNLWNKNTDFFFFLQKNEKHTVVLEFPHFSCDSDTKDETAL